MIALDIPAQAPEKEKKSERKKGRKNKVKKEEREGAESKEGGKEKVKETLEELFNLKQRSGGSESKKNKCVRNGPFRTEQSAASSLGSDVFVTVSGFFSFI